MFCFQSGVIHNDKIQRTPITENFRMVSDQLISKFTLISPRAKTSHISNTDKIFPMSHKKLLNRISIKSLYCIKPNNCLTSHGSYTYIHRSNYRSVDVSRLSIGSGYYIHTIQNIEQVERIQITDRQLEPLLC